MCGIDPQTDLARFQAACGLDISRKVAWIIFCVICALPPRGGTTRNLAGGGDVIDQATGYSRLGRSLALPLFE